MLPFPELAFEAPDSLAEALRLLGEPGARVLAGGTDLLPSLKHGLFSPTTLVSVRRIQEISVVEPLADGGIAIGAGLTLREVARIEDVRTRWPALAEACMTVGTSTIQAMGTLGGNVLLDTRCLYYNQPDGWREALGGCLKKGGSVCHVAPRGKGCYAAHSADTVPVLWLYDARVELASAGGARQVRIVELFGEDGREGAKLRNGEILTRIVLPAPSGRVVHRKLRMRQAIDYAQLLVAVAGGKDGLRAVVSAIGPRPIEVHGTSVEELAEHAVDSCQPLATHGTAPPWRKRMVRVEITRAAAVLAQS